MSKKGITLEDTSLKEFIKLETDEKKHAFIGNIQEFYKFQTSDKQQIELSIPSKNSKNILKYDVYKNDCLIMLKLLYLSKNKMSVKERKTVWDYIIYNGNNKVEDTDTFNDPKIDIKRLFKFHTVEESEKASHGIMQRDINEDDRKRGIMGKPKEIIVKAKNTQDFTGNDSGYADRVKRQVKEGQNTGFVSLGGGKRQKKKRKRKKAFPSRKKNNRKNSTKKKARK